MFIIVPVLLAVLAGYLRGGQLWNFSRLRLHFTWVPLVMFVLQLSLVLFPIGPSEEWHWLRPGVTAATYGVLLVFLIANRGMHGFKTIVLGTALNLTVILANGGYMPVTLEALARSGHLDRVVVRGDHAYVLGSKDIVLTREETRLAALTDVFGVPESFPLSATFSAGDVLIVFGASWFMFKTMVEKPQYNPAGIASNPIVPKLSEAE